MAHKIDVIIVAPQASYEKPDRSGFYSETDLEIGRRLLNDCDCVGSKLLVNGIRFVVSKIEGKGLLSNTVKQLSKFNWFNELDQEKQSRLAELQQNMR